MFKIYKVKLYDLCKYTNITQSVNNSQKGIDKAKGRRYTVKAVAGNERERGSRDSKEAPWKLYSETTNKPSWFLVIERQQREKRNDQAK